MIPDEHAFVVRIWHEQRDFPADRPILRGVVDHLSTGARRYVVDFQTIVMFIQSCVSGAVSMNDPKYLQTSQLESTMEKPTKNADVVRALDFEATRREMEATLLENSPIYKRHVEMMQFIYGETRSGAGLSQRERILLALGMAVHAGRDSAIDWTVTRALNHGASPDSIREAIDVALLNGGTLIVSHARFAYNALALRLKQRPKSEQEFVVPGVNREPSKPVEPA